MTRAPLSLAAGMVLDVPPAGAVDVAAAAGFDAVGLRFTRPSPDPDTATLRDVRRLCHERGMRILDVEFVRLTADGRYDELNRRLVDVAVELEAAHLLCVSLDDDDARTADGLASLAELAAGSDLVAVLEFMRFTAVRSLAAARAVVERTGRADVAILVDALHLARGGESPADVAALPRALVPYVQVCDAPARPPADTDEALGVEARTDRLLPGDGELPLVDLVSALPPDVPLSVEVLSDRLMDQHEPAHRAGLAMAATRRVLASVEFHGRDAGADVSPPA